MWSSCGSGVWSMCGFWSQRVKQQFLLEGSRPCLKGPCDDDCWLPQWRKLPMSSVEASGDPTHEHCSGVCGCHGGCQGPQWLPGSTEQAMGDVVAFTLWLILLFPAVSSCLSFAGFPWRSFLCGQSPPFFATQCCSRFLIALHSFQGCFHSWITVYLLVFVGGERHLRPTILFFPALFHWLCTSRAMLSRQYCVVLDLQGKSWLFYHEVC